MNDLVKRLRDAAKMSEALAVLLPHSEGNETAKLFNEAADAIEDLEFACNRYEKDYKDLCAYLPKWVPVTERLPEKGYYVLVYEDGDIMMASYSDRDRGWFLRDMYEIIELKPTHWMPLPEPPKEE